MITVMGLALVCILVITGIALFFLFFQATSSANPSQQSSIPSSSRSRPQSSAQSSSSRQKNYASSLEKQILTLVYGDRETASRLVNTIYKKYPEKDRIWCLEKVISDLERDRR